MIKLSNLVKICNKGQANEHAVLENINLEIGRGEMVSVIGKSGAGKSTLLQVLAGITDYDKGEYYFGKQLIKKMSDYQLARFRNERVGIVLQDFSLIEEFKAFDNVILPLEFSHRYTKAKMTKIGKELLKYVNLEKKAEQIVHTMSGGEKQRIAIARALANSPDVILADEPTGALDSESTFVIMQLLHKVHRAGKTVMIVTHDMEVASQCERIITISDGKIKEDTVLTGFKDHCREGK